MIILQGEVQSKGIMKELSIWILLNFLTQYGRVTAQESLISDYCEPDPPDIPHDIIQCGKPNMCLSYFQFCVSVCLCIELTEYGTLMTGQHSKYAKDMSGSRMKSIPWIGRSQLLETQPPWHTTIFGLVSFTSLGYVSLSSLE